MYLYLLLNAFFGLLCLGYMLMMPRRAHKLKTDENYRNSIINQRGNEINEEGELYTGFRRYKSVDGYIKYQYASSTAWGIIAVIYFAVSVAEGIFRNQLNYKLSIFLIIMIATDYIIYRRNKNV